VKRRRRFKLESFELLRRRMIAETELALVYGLRFPERVPRIPSIEVGVGSFRPDYAAQFWSGALGLDADELAVLNGRPPDDRITL
jgi:hypothetical protein